MASCRRSLLGRGAFLALLAMGTLPGAASAHAVGESRFDAPIPLWLLFAGAGATVALTALLLAVSDREGGSVAGDRSRRLLTVPAATARAVRTGTGVLFLAAVLGALVAGVTGRQVAAENAATVFVWPVWFRGLALVAVLFGTPWPVLSPWRAVYRGLTRLEGSPPAVLDAPPDLGAWPAVVGLVLLLGVLENLTLVPRSPALTTAVVATYGLAMVGGAVLYGRNWLRAADPLGLFYRLLARVAPVDVTRSGEGEGGGYDISLRPPWTGCLTSSGDGSLVVAVVAMVYTVTFDGFTATRAFQTVLFGVRDALGTGPGTSLLLYLVGLAGFVLAFVATSAAVERLGAGGVEGWRAAARRFAPTVLPIAAAYEVAHNYPFVLRNLGRLPAVAFGSVVPGLAPVDPLWWLSLPAFWGSQVLLVVLGHVVAVVAAHRVAVGRYGPRAGLRGHLPLVALMVGYTVLSLWIVSRPVVTG